MAACRARAQAPRARKFLAVDAVRVDEGRDPDPADHLGLLFGIAV